MTAQIDLTGDSGVVKTVLVESTDGETPEKGNEVEMHYIGKLANGEVFDNSYDRGVPLKFVLGEGALIKGCDVAIASMKVGEKALVEIQPEYGYGEAGAGDKIPPNSVLHFEVELVSTRPKPKDRSEMSMDQLIQGALNAKETGNSKFLKGKHGDAIAYYEEGVYYLSARDEWPEEPKKASDLTLLQCYLNLANCYIKVKDYVKAEMNVERALKMDPANVKGLYRRALIKLNTEAYAEAMQDLAKLIKTDPKNAEAIKLYQTAKAKLQEVNSRAKKYYGSVFKGLSLYDDKKGLRQIKDCPKVYFDITIGEDKHRMVFALFNDTVPKTAKNFQQLCDETYEHNFKGNKFHRLIKGFMIQGGDITNGDGTGGISIYGEKFDDEAFEDQHTSRGLLSMANCGPNTNSSQFFITFAPCQHLDGKHVVFGTVVEGMEVLDLIEAVETEGNDRPVVDITIQGCGSL